MSLDGIYLCLFCHVSHVHVFFHCYLLRINITILYDIMSYVLSSSFFSVCCTEEKNKQVHRFRGNQGTIIRTFKIQLKYCQCITDCLYLCLYFFTLIQTSVNNWFLHKCVVTYWLLSETRYRDYNVRHEEHVWTSDEWT